jgi:hypothetical protein
VTRRRLWGRAGTAALALLAAGVIGAAVADSIRKSGHSRRTVTHAPKPPPAADLRLADRVGVAARLHREGARGVLYFVDRACRLRALRLPSLESAPAPRDGGCRALVSPSTAPPGWSLWPRDTPLAAYCERGRVIVSGSAGESLPMIGGCSPAWRLDGSMTYIRRGAIVQFPRTGRARVVRSREQLALALERAPALRGTTGWRATNVAWLGPTRFAIVAERPGRAVLAVFAGRRIVAVAGVPRRVSELMASPRGSYLVLRALGTLHVYRVARSSLTPGRRFGVPVAIAWSPDERWVAVAWAARIVLARAGEQIALPLPAIDLAWTRALS